MFCPINVAYSVIKRQKLQHHLKLSIFSLTRVGAD
uniref:Uncharacterized protein n=1 Tax=Lepeophtheirus salmonis TaxID=72036 RepID=A0A0K2U498_LEPSM